MKFPEDDSYLGSNNNTKHLRQPTHNTQREVKLDLCLSQLGRDKHLHHQEGENTKPMHIFLLIIYSRPVAD
ncbi:hypothetical protein Tsubulata_031141 [Turnera subulata]|uniref:Uncharacterized protein n=1 Tax=Turnera subulata TaxID=218843 RepID=A0A9Q0EZX7_9ROSI|nr:hypothetical protein Tsubulata_011637 [Turnera subulata]KAJ4830948.1 hypothetical protein Tsubulata_031141 [Turnera subulata]